MTVSEDASVRVWDFEARQAPATACHVGRVYCVVGAADGSVLATCGEECSVRLWDGRTCALRGLLQGHKVPVRWCAFSADGGQLVTASPDRCVRLWDVASMELLREVPGQQRQLWGRGGGGVWWCWSVCSSLLWHPFWRELPKCPVLGLTTATGLPLPPMPSHPAVTDVSRIRSFAASADLRRGVVCKWDSTVTVLDLQASAGSCCCCCKSNNWKRAHALLR